MPWVEQSWRKLDGTPLIVEAAATAVPWHDATAAQVILRDITEQRRAAKEREALLEAAEEANRAKDTFLATLSHELRTPLNAVLGWAYMMKSSRLPVEEYARAAEAIHRNCELQKRLVDDMLDFSAIVSGKLTLRFNRLDFSAMVSDVAANFSPTIRIKGQHLRLNVAPGCLVVADADRLREVVWNLLSNAAKFSPAEAVVTVRVLCDRDKVVLSSGGDIGLERFWLLMSNLRTATYKNLRDPKTQEPVEIDILALVPTMSHHEQDSHGRALYWLERDDKYVTITRSVAGRDPSH